MTKKEKPSKRLTRKTVGIVVGVSIAIIAIIAIGGISLFVPENRPPMAAAAESSLANGIAFHDLETQMKEFIAYNESIKLTSQQEAVKKAALERGKAVCCDDYTAYTCCCNCNLSKSLWGLSNYLIAVKRLNADQVAEATRQWIDHTNPSGFTGNACYTGGCGRASHANGCGGMSESNIVL